MSMNRDEYLIAQATRTHWSNVSKRTILYYAALLTRQHKDARKANIKRELKEMVSIQTGAFEEVIEEFEVEGIIYSAATCTLSTPSYNEVDRLLGEHAGSSTKIPYDGLQIYRANETTRWDLWVDMGTRRLAKLFCDGDNRIKMFTQDQPRRRGRILLFDAGFDMPALLIWLVNSKRITRASELDHISREARLYEAERLRDKNYIGRGKLVLDIVGAPTYDDTVARESYVGRYTNSLIGPINLAIIEHFITTTYIPVYDCYTAILDYIDHTNSDQHRRHTGIIDAFTLMDYIKYSYSGR